MASCEEPNSRMPGAVVVPGQGSGHLNPCVLLAKALAALGFEVSFVYFSSDYADLTAKKCLPELGSNAHTVGRDPCCGGGGRRSRSSSKTEEGFIEIHVLDDGLASGPDVDKPFFFCTPAMQENLFRLILELREQGRAPTCLVADPVKYWTRHVAQRAGIPLINFWISNAMAYLHTHLFSLGIAPEKGYFDQSIDEIELMLDQSPGMPKLASVDASIPHVPLLLEVPREITSCARHSERMLLHTLSELEPNTSRAFQAVGVRGYAVGPLLPYAKRQELIGASVQAEDRVPRPANEGMDSIVWLNAQADSSVIYVSFGSQASISTEDIQELAWGLEASANPFLWVIRYDSRGDQGLSQMLPDGFLDRTSEKGMIIGWAPQMDVLAHKAIGGFLTHCGWNSTLESLWEGVPMLCWPTFADQWYNSHYVCDVWGVGFHLRQPDKSGLERSHVEVCVKRLMQEEEGLKARVKAQELKQLSRKTCQPGGQSFSNLHKFYEDMKALSCKESLQTQKLK